MKSKLKLIAFIRQERPEIVYYQPGLFPVNKNQLLYDNGSNAISSRCTRASGCGVSVK
jgi:hypothetical protein